MDSIKITERIVAGIVLMILIAAGGCSAEDYHVRKMADKGYCYQSVDRINTQTAFQFQKCK